MRCTNRKCAYEALKDVVEYLHEEDGQVAVSVIHVLFTAVMDLLGIRCYKHYKGSTTYDSRGVS